MHLRPHLLLCMSLLWLTACGGLTLPTPRAALGPQAVDYPDAAAAVLQDEATLEYRMMRPPDGGPARLLAVLDHYRRIKILRPEGVKFGTLDLPLDGMTTVPAVVGRTIARNGEVSSLSSRRIFVRRGVAETQAPEVRTLVAMLDDVEPGATVEFRYQRVFLDPYDVPVWTYGDVVPVLHASFGVIADVSADVDFLHGKGDMGRDRAPNERDQVGAKGRTKFIETDLPAYFPEPHGTHLAHRSPWTLAALRRVRVGERIERMDGWPDVAAHIGALMKQSEPSRGRGAIPGTAMQRLSHVRQTLVPQPGMGVGIRQPQRPKELESGSPACSRDAAAYTRGLLADLGQGLDVVLLTGPAAPPFGESFPSLAPFSQVVVRLAMQPSFKAGLRCEGPAYEQDLLCQVPVGERIYFQPTCPTCALGTLPSGSADTRAMVIDHAGQAQWIDVDVGSPSRHALRTKLTYRLDVDGHAGGTIDAKAHGQLASVWRTALAHSAGKGASAQEQAADAVHYQAIFGAGEGPHASDLHAKGVEAVDHEMEVHGGVAALVKRVGDDYALRPEVLFGSSLPNDWHGGRRDTLVTDGPSWKESTATVVLPLDVAAQLPPPTRIVHPIFEYASGFAQKGRTLSYARRFVMKASRIAADDWPSAFEALEAVRVAEQQPLSLMFVESR